MKTPHITPLRVLTLSAGIALSMAGCGKHTDHDHAAHADPTTAHHHEHTSPHGGTAVVLGKETFHVELVRDATAGKLSAYILDGEMENFIRLNGQPFEVVAKIGTADELLLFKPVSNPATGETESDTSLYEVTAEWLKTTPSFYGVIPLITVRGQEFRSVKFNFPLGNETP